MCRCRRTSRGHPGVAAVGSVSPAVPSTVATSPVPGGCCVLPIPPAVPRSSLGLRRTGKRGKKGAVSRARRTPLSQWRSANDQDAAAAASPPPQHLSRRAICRPPGRQPVGGGGWGGSGVLRTAGRERRGGPQLCSAAKGRWPVPDGRGGHGGGAPLMRSPAAALDAVPRPGPPTPAGVQLARRLATASGCHRHDCHTPSRVVVPGTPDPPPPPPPKQPAHTPAPHPTAADAPLTPGPFPPPSAAAPLWAARIRDRRLIRVGEVGLDEATAAAGQTHQGRGRETRRERARRVRAGRGKGQKGKKKGSTGGREERGGERGRKPHL